MSKETVPDYSGIKITKLPPGRAAGAGDLTKWAHNRAVGRTGVDDAHEIDKVVQCPKCKASTIVLVRKTLHRTRQLSLSPLQNSFACSSTKGPQMIIRPCIEQWRPVTGFENEYEVSNLGQVRSLDRVKIYQRKDQYSGQTLSIERLHRGRVLRAAAQPSGHLTVVLGRKEGSRLVHQLVLEAFVGPCPTGHEGCHENDVPDDNRLHNLSWGTRSQNVKDSIRNGKRKPGGRYKAKLAPEQVREIRAKVGSRPKGAKMKPSMASIAASYGVGEGCVRKIVHREHWRNL